MEPGEQKKLYAIYVPDESNEGTKYPLEHHHAWDAYVRGVTGGLTIFRRTKGEWVSPDGTNFREPMIPVQIMCTQSELGDIVRFSLKHYSQLAIMTYKVSDEVRIWSKDEFR